MKWIIAVLLVLSPFTDLDKIAKVNKAKKEAKQAYLANNFELASNKYKYLIDSLGVNEEEVLLDYAHTLYNLNDTTTAVINYQELSESTNKNIASIAEQQLGQVLFDKKQYEPALEHYKNALRNNPSNADARYNYELLKKILKKQEEEQKDQQNQDKDQDKKDQKEQDKDKKDQDKEQDQKDQQQKDQEKKDQEKKDQEQQQKDQQEKQDQEQKDQEKKDGEKDEDQQKKEEQKEQEQKEGEKSEEKEKEKPKPTPSDKLKELNISEEKAQMILEAMKNNEIQYIQQNRRKATKKKKSDKPDW